MKKKIIQKIEGRLFGKYVVLCIVSLLLSFKGIAQTDTEFWFAAPEVDSSHADSSIMRFASINAVDVIISIPKNPSFTPIMFHLAANSDTLIDWNKIGPGKVNYKNAIENTALDIATNKGIHIVATDKIEAYYEVKTLPNSEVFALKGANALGRLFYANFQNYWYNKPPILSNGDDTLQFGTSTTTPVGLDSLPLPFAINDYQDIVAENSWSAFDIVATEDGTTIDITPTNPVISSNNVLDQFGYVASGTLHPAGVTYSITLDAGQTYSGRQAYKNPTRSIGGTKIQVTNPSGHKIALTCKEDGLMAWNHDNSGIYLNPTDNSTTNLYDWSNYAMDLIGDQMIPVDLIGNEYVVMRGGLYPDADQNPNTPPKTWDFDGERVFLTGTQNGTPITISSYRNDGTLLNTYTTTLNEKQVFAYTFKYSTNKNDIEQFLRISAPAGYKFYTYHVSGQISELGSGIIPTIEGCTGSTQLAFTRSYNGLFQVNLMVKAGAEGSFKVFDSKGNDVSTTFNIKATDFKAIGTSGWSVYIQPNNDWTNKALIDQTYIIKNSLNVFHLGILNISSFKGIDTNRIPQYIGWYSNPKNLKTFKGYDFAKTVPSSVIATVWKNPDWTIKMVDKNPTDHIYYSLTNKTADTVIFVAHWFSDSRGAFYGYFSDFNKFSPFAAVPDANHPKCLGDTIKLVAAGGVTYTWSQPANLKFIDPATAQNPRVVPQVTGSYVLNVHIVGFCSKDTTYTFSFKVISTPKPTITGPLSICLEAGNQSYTVSVADTNGFGTSAKTWSVTGGTIISGQGTKSLSVQWSGTDPHTVSVSIDNKSCAIGTATLPISIVPAPTVTVPSLPISVCSGEVVPVSNLVSSPTGAAYAWSNSNTAIGLAASGTGQVPSFTAKNATSALISATIYVTPTLGCVGTLSSYIINVKPTPTVTVPTSPITVCNGATVAKSTFTSSPTGATFEWTNSNSTIGLGLNSTGQVPTFTATNPGTAAISATIYVTPTLNSCVGTTKSYDIVVNPSDNASFIYSPFTFCQTGSNPTPTITGLAGGTFSSPSSLVFVSTTTGQINLATTPLGTYQIVYTTKGTCPNTASNNVTITTAPTAKFAYAGPYCKEDPNPNPTYNTGSSGGSFSAIPAGLTFVSTSSGQVDLKASTPGTYTVTNAIAAADGCAAATATATITIKPTPTVSVPANITICNFGKVATTAFASNITGTITWTNTTPSIGLATGGSGQISSFTALNSVNTPVVATITVTPPTNGCTVASSSYTITVNPSPVINNINEPVCQSSTETITVHSKGGTKPLSSGSWTNIAGSSVTYSAIDSSLTVNANTTNASTQFRYILSDNLGCSDTSIVTIQNVANPVVTISTQSVCQNLPLNVKATVTPSKVVTLWDSSPIIPSTQLSSTNFDAITSSSGNVTVQLTATDTNGCKTTGTGLVNIYPKPVASVSPATNTHICQNAPLTLNGQTYPNVVTYKWAGDVASISPNAQITTFKSSVLGDHDFQFIVVTDHACTDTIPYKVIVDENPVFTLGSDIAACAGISKSLTVNPSGGSGDYIYDWSDENGTFNLPHDNAPTYVKTKSGIYHIHLTVTDNTTKCKSSDTLIVTINENPVVSPITDELCAGITKTIDGKPSGGKTPYAIHAWSGTDYISLITGQTTQTPVFQSSKSGPHYLHYKVTDANGCFGENDATITVNASPQPVITGKPLLQVCAKATLPIAVSGIPSTNSFNWSGNGALYLSSITVQNPTFKSSVAGTYQLTVTSTDGKSCAGFDVISIKVNPLPTPVMKNDSLCAGDKINLKGDNSFSQYKWTGDVTPIPVAERTSSSPSFSTATTTVTQTYNLMYTVTDGNNCTDSVAVKVKANALPATFAGLDKGFADGDKVPLVALPNGSQYSYAWSPATSLDNAIIQNPTTIPLHATTTFILTVTDNITKCKAIDDIKLTNITGPLEVIIEATPSEICLGDTSNIDVKPSGGKAPYTYAWSTSVEKQYADGSVRVKPIITTNYIITVSDQNGATATATTTVTVNQLPTITLSDKSVCANDTLLIEPKIETQLSSTISTYTWSGATAGLHGVTNKANVQYYLNTKGQYQLTLQVVDSKTCSSSNSMNVTVNELPTVTIQPNKPEICAGYPLAISINQTGGAAISNYSWTDIPAGSLASKIGSTNTFTANVSGDITLAVVDANGCKASTNNHIIVDQNPIIVAKDTAVCQNTILILDGKPSGGSGVYTSHTWSGTDVAKLATTNTQKTNFNTKIAGSYSVDYTVIDDKTCKTTKALKVAINSLPTATYSPGILEVCSGSPLTITASPSPLASITSYRWIEPGKPLQGNSTQVTLKADSVGIKKIYFEAITNQSCKLLDSLFITLKPKPTIKITPEKAQVCESEIDKLSSEYSGGTNTPLSFTWSTNPVSPAVLSSFNAQNTEFMKELMGSVDVSLIYVDQNSCSDTDKVTIKVNPNPVVKDKNIILSACNGQDKQIDANPTSIPKRLYTWIGGTGLTYIKTDASNYKTDHSNPVFKVGAVGTYTLVYNVSETEFNCSATGTITINVNETPTAITEDEIVCQGSDLILNVGGMNASTYVWKSTVASNLTLLTPSTISNPKFLTAKGGTYDYTVIGTSTNACSETATVHVVVVSKPTITNVPVSQNVYYNQKYDYKPIVLPSTGVTYSWTPITAFDNASIKDAKSINVKADILNILFQVTETASGKNCSTEVPSKLIVAKKMEITTKDVTICEEESVTITADVQNGASPKVFTWIVDGKTFTGSTLNYNPTASTKATISVTDGYDTVSTVATITVNKKPVMSDITKDVCVDDKLVLDVTTANVVSYVWKGNNSDADAALSNKIIANPTFKSSIANIYTYSVTGTTVNGCKDNSTVTIKNWARPIIKLQDTISVYTKQSYEFTQALIGASNPKESYTWSPADFFVKNTIRNATTIPITEEKQATIIITELSSPLGCQTFDTTYFKLNPPFVPHLNITELNVCKGKSGTVAVTVSGGGPNITYKWDIEGKEYTTSSVNVTPIKSSTITVTVTDMFDVKVLNVNVVVYPVPTVKIKPDINTYVIGNEHTFSAYDTLGTKPFKYFWSANKKDSLNLKTTKITTFISNHAGLDTLSVLVEDAHMCTAFDTITFKKVNLPIWPNDLCSGNEYKFGIASDSIFKWVFKGNIDTTIIGNTGNVVFTKKGSGSITLYDLSDTLQPIYVHNMNINISPYVNFIYSPDTGISISETVQFENLSILDANKNIVPNNMVFFWDFVGDDVYTSQEINPNYSYDDIGKYNVSLIGMDTITKCRDTVTKKLEVTPNPLCGLKFPNAFTPDDIKDNNFLPGYIVGIKDSGYDLKVYNRWGQLLFETQEKTGHWDGFYNGQVCKQDVYVYHCRAVCENGRELFINGDVTIIK